MEDKFSKERIFYLIITLAMVIVIFLVSSISSFPTVSTGFDLSIIYHFGAFFMFTFFLTLTLTNKKLDNKTILIVLLLSLIYSLSDEFHQLFVPGRFADVKDVTIDFVGSLCSVLIIKFIKRFRKI